VALVQQELQSAEAVGSQASSEVEELRQMWAVDQETLRQHQVEQEVWQQEVSALATEFEALHVLAGNAVKLPRALHVLEEQCDIRELAHRRRLEASEQEARRLHKERAAGLEALGELSVFRLKEAERREEYVEASVRSEDALQVQEARAAELQARLSQLESHLDCGTIPARVSQFQSTFVTADGTIAARRRRQGGKAHLGQEYIAKVDEEIDQLLAIGTAQSLECPVKRKPLCTLSRDAVRADSPRRHRSPSFFLPHFQHSVGDGSSPADTSLPTTRCRSFSCCSSSPLCSCSPVASSSAALT